MKGDERSFDRYLVPTVIEQSGRGERCIRYIFSAFERAQRILGRTG